MGTVNYEQLVSGLIKPLTTHPDDVIVEVTSEVDDTINLKAIVHKDDIGRVIGKKGRVATAIRTLAHVAATREKKRLEIDFETEEEN